MDDRSGQLLLPASVQDFVGEDHLARFVLFSATPSLVRSKRLTRASGQPPFDPAMMTRRCCFKSMAMARPHLSRRIAKAARERVDLTRRCSGSIPLDFRDRSRLPGATDRNAGFVCAGFPAVRQLRWQAGHVGARRHERPAANVTKHKAMSYERMGKRAAELVRPRLRDG